MKKKKPGFVFLISVLVIGAIAIAMVLSLTLLGLAAQQNSLTVGQSTQAYEYAQSCAERAFLDLRSDLSYDGGTMISFDDGTCTVLHTAGGGNADRALCIEGRSGRSIRRFEIAIAQVYPAVHVTSWKEVSAFSLCP